MLSWLDQFKVGTRLISCFLLVAAIGGFIGTQGVLKSGQINALADQMYEQETLALRHAAEANLDLLAAGRYLRTAILAASQEERDRAVAITRERLQEMHRELDLASRGFVSAEGKAKVEETRSAAQRYVQDLQGVLDALAQEPLGQASGSTAQLAPAHAAAATVPIS